MKFRTHRPIEIGKIYRVYWNDLHCNKIFHADVKIKNIYKKDSEKIKDKNNMICDIECVVIKTYYGHDSFYARPLPLDGNSFYSQTSINSRYIVLDKK